MRALEAISLFPEVVHINEGHAAFALLERIKMLMKKYNLDFRAAKNLNNASAVFTTHTPVPAGNEAFDIDKIDAYLHNHYYKDFGFTKESFCELGQFANYNPNESFSMTILGLRMTSYRNGVSKLHGVVSRDMWANIWKTFPVDEVPISSITNGIHTTTWVAREFAELFDRYLTPNWRYLTDEVEWNKIHSIPSEELWREKQRRRVRLVLFAREYLKTRSKRAFPSAGDSLASINSILNPDTLTIGFARRFATYKRANLIFKNMAKLRHIITNHKKPIQIIIAGKAHPHDTQGKEVIQSIIQSVRQHNLEKHIIFLEDYDMVIARMMVKGCDVWLNNPIRPLEASGTSGMKAALNGTLNLSILDGWWDEAYNGSNGFAIGVGEEHENTEEVEIIESDMIYDLLETVIAPTFYNRSSNTNIPEEWIKMMKNCIETNAPMFSTSRMVKEYAVRFYIPALNSYKELSENSGNKAKQLQVWKDKIRAEWHNVQVLNVDFGNNSTVDMKDTGNVKASIKLGSLEAEDVQVQVYYGVLDHQGNITNPAAKALNMVKREGDTYNYEGSFKFYENGVQGFTVRILPNHPLLPSSTDLFLCTWANGKE
jgi:starch phosphorylase